MEEHSGTIVIFGDVKEGAQVIAGEDIIVLGRYFSKTVDGQNPQSLSD